MAGHTERAAGGRTETAFPVQAGNGAWESLHYVESANAPVNWEELLRPDLIKRGPKYPLDAEDPSGLVDGCKERFGDTVTQVSVYDANTECDTVPDYRVVIALVTAHEQ